MEPPERPTTYKDIKDKIEAAVFDSGVVESIREEYAIAHQDAFIHHSARTGRSMPASLADQISNRELLNPQVVLERCDAEHPVPTADDSSNDDAQSSSQSSSPSNVSSIFSIHESSIDTRNVNFTYSDEDEDEKEPRVNPIEGDGVKKEAFVDPHEGDAAEKEGRVDPLEGDVAEAETSLDQVERDVTEKEACVGQVEGVEKATCVDPVEGDITVKEAFVAPLEADVTEKRDVNPVEVDVIEKEGGVNPIIGDVSQEQPTGAEQAVDNNDHWMDSPPPIPDSDEMFSLVADYNSLKESLTTSDQLQAPPAIFDENIAKASVRLTTRPDAYNSFRLIAASYGESSSESETDEAVQPSTSHSTSTMQRSANIEMRHLSEDINMIDESSSIAAPTIKLIESKDDVGKTATNDDYREKSSTNIVVASTSTFRKDSNTKESVQSSSTNTPRVTRKIETESPVKVRRSSRPKPETKNAAKLARLKVLNKLITEGDESDFEVKQSELIPGAGLGLFTLKEFNIGDYVIHYTGKRLTNSEGIKQEKQYIAEGELDTNYMYKFSLAGVTYWIDATDKDTCGLARFINHSIPYQNIKPVAISVPKIGPTVFFKAERFINKNEELFYNYDETRADVLKQYPWLKD